uniref:Uncharacterized protein n=1 Tax=Rangifer tarandus platyrhynchus TaxID=3082113 RepID=A0ACB0EQW8_RANTA|nr:unnamed protein product [Rangifer tarandus platyrhynchus]
MITAVGPRCFRARKPRADEESDRGQGRAVGVVMEATFQTGCWVWPLRCRSGPPPFTSPTQTPHLQKRRAAAAAACWKHEVLQSPWFSSPALTGGPEMRRGQGAVLFLLWAGLSHPGALPGGGAGRPPGGGEWEAGENAPGRGEATATERSQAWRLLQAEDPSTTRWSLVGSDVPRGGALGLQEEKRLGAGWTRARVKGERGRGMLGLRPPSLPRSQL